MMMAGGKVLPVDVCHSAVPTVNATAKTAGFRGRAVSSSTPCRNRSCLP